MAVAVLGAALLGAAVAPSADAAAGTRIVLLDGAAVTLPNQGDLPKVFVFENVALNCRTGTIRVGTKIELSSGKSLSLTAPTGEAILAVSIKSGVANVSTVSFSATGATVSTTQDISNYVVVYCQPKDEPDTSPPVCALSATATNGAGAKYIQVTLQDPQSGIQGIVIDDVRNASLTYTPDPYAGSKSPVIVTATKVDQTKSSFLKLTVTNLAGLSTTCDPEVPAVKVQKAAPRRLVAPLLNRRGGR